MVNMSALTPPFPQPGEVGGLKGHGGLHRNPNFKIIVIFIYHKQSAVNKISKYEYSEDF